MESTNSSCRVEPPEPPGPDRGPAAPGDRTDSGGALATGANIFAEGRIDVSSSNRSSKDHYLVIGTGRTGSSLLCAILDRAGADFGLPGRETWDRGSGSYEQDELHAAYRWYHRARKVSDSLLPQWGIHGFCMGRCRSHLERALERARYLKSTTLVWLVDQIQSLGYLPRIILSYRRFAGYAPSRYLRHGWDYKKLVETYRNANGTALMLLKMFGGCTVPYRCLVDPDETRWIRTLCEVTGLSEEGVRGARRELLRKPRNRAASSLEVPRTRSVYERLSDHDYQVVDGTLRPASQE